jgi:hypothetical protein
MRFQAAFFVWIECAGVVVRCRGSLKTGKGFSGCLWGKDFSDGAAMVCC